jgi:hypothetical protein
MAFDHAAEGIVLFGGYADSGYLDDTWVFNGTAWSQVFPDIAPSARTGHEMVYDLRKEKAILFGGSLGSVHTDTWEFADTRWRQVIPTGVPVARSSFAMAYDPIRGAVVLFGGSTATSDANDTWLLSYTSVWPDESCQPGEDVDGDGLAFCEDPDCAYVPHCLRCGNGTCDGDEWCGNCPDDCGTCTGCSAADVQLSEVHGGAPAYVEIVNSGACVWDAGGLTLLFRNDCDQAPQAYTFPPGTVLLPGAVHRAVELRDATLPNESSTGAPIGDAPIDAGWVLLCDGFCDLAACTNVLDHFQKQGATLPGPPPACATFTPAPLLVTGAGAGDSATRVGFGGSGAAGVQSDWSVQPMSRN